MLELIRQILCLNDGEKVYVKVNGKKTAYILKRNKDYSPYLCNEDGVKTDYTIESLIKQCVDDPSSVEFYCSRQAYFHRAVVEEIYAYINNEINDEFEFKASDIDKIADNIITFGIGWEDFNQTIQDNVDDHVLQNNNIE